MTVERFHDESVNPPFRTGPDELGATSPQAVPLQRRTEPTTGPEEFPGRADPSGPFGPTGDNGPMFGAERGYGAEPAYGYGYGPDSDSEVEDGPGADGPPPEEQPPPPTRGADAPSPRHKPWPSPRQQTASAVMILCILITLFLLGHRYLPGSMGVASLLESWLPWLAIPIGVLVLAAAALRKPRALVAAAVAAAVWLAGYGPALLPRGGGLPAQLRVYSADINGQPGELSRAGAMAVAQHADLVALQDVYGDLAGSSGEAKLNAAYPANHVTQYEFGVWSKYPIVASVPIDLGTSTVTAAGDGQGLVADGTAQQVFGALKVTIATPEGDLVAYVVHVPQPVLNDNGFANARNAAVKRLAAVVSADPAARLIMVGDVNIAATDREFSVIQQDLKLTSAQSAAGQGFGFTWPAEFPAVRLDDVLSRTGVTAERSVVMPAIGTGKTHLPILVDLHL